MPYRLRFFLSRQSGCAGSPGALLLFLAVVSLVAVGLPRGGAAAAQEAAAPAPSVTSPEREQYLLTAAFRYLKLSPVQLRSLLQVAMRAEQRRNLIRAQERETERALQVLENDGSEEATRLQDLIQQRRAAGAVEITQLTTPLLTRILTREQIALVWRLYREEPPKYADADPALLEPTAGFTKSCIERHHQEFQRRALLGNALLRQNALEEQRIDLETRALEVLEGRLGVEGDSLILTEPSFRLDLPGGGNVDKPFPQLVAETENAAELFPAVEPFARRLFLSDQLTPAIRAALIRSDRGTPTARRSPGVDTLPVVRDYRAERGLRDLSGRGPELEPLGGQLAHGHYVFGPGQGLRLADSGVTDHYAVQLIFRFEGGASYQKLIDFKGGTKDGGLYLYQGHVTFYTLANGGAPQPGREHRLRLERNRATRIVRAYLDWRPIFAFIDLDDEAVFDDRKSLLFVDDKSTNGEHGPGALRSVTFWGPASAR